MDKTQLVREVAELFRASGHKVDTSVRINHREIDVRAEELNSLVRKTILVECADYENTVGVEKLQEDLLKLRAAKETLKDDAVIMHVSRNGYTPDAAGYAADAHIPAYIIADLQARLINFDPYIQAVETDPVRQTILKEYQPNNLRFEGRDAQATPAISFLKDWLASGGPWLTLLGDYGVGKSWTLKRFLYEMVQDYKAQPSTTPLPLFIPLQRFTKAFDFENLIMRTLHLYGVAGVFYTALEYLMHKGRIVFLLDSFDEMAQHLSRETIRENLKEMLVGISAHSRAIMTSRPNYFEGRAERLLVVERDGVVEWHPLDAQQHSIQAAASRQIQERLHESQFGRIADLSAEQRRRLFAVVLGEGSEAHTKLMGLFNRFRNLGEISQRAVIARLLTTVASTIAQSKELVTIDGYPLLPDDLKLLNEAKVFEVVVYNLLFRDQAIGSLSTAQRLHFLRSFAVYLQQRDRVPFATPEEIRALVAHIFAEDLRRSDSPEQLLEAHYRTCRRHSGLTTEGQFRDTSGQLDLPVDERDTESRVGFSHNSLREFLVADTLAQFLRTPSTVEKLRTVLVTDAVGDFMFGLSEIDPTLGDSLARSYAQTSDDIMREQLFRLICTFIRHDRQFVRLLGSPPKVCAVDLSGTDLSALQLSGAAFEDCVAKDASFEKSDLRNARFDRCIFENVALDQALINGCDMRTSELASIYVFDEFDSRTKGILRGKQARQWLYTRGARVHPTDDLNPYLGQPWYSAAREVAATITRRITGSFQDVSLSKGTRFEQRDFAIEFVEFLTRKGILERVKRSNRGPGYVVKLNRDYCTAITEFSQKGTIGPVLNEFFARRINNT